jgi:hypothetical protein
MKRKKKLRRVSQEGRSSRMYSGFEEEISETKDGKVAADKIGVDEGATMLQEVLTEAGIAAKMGLQRSREARAGQRDSIDHCVQSNETRNVLTCIVT